MSQAPPLTVLLVSGLGTRPVVADVGSCPGEVGNHVTWLCSVVWAAHLSCWSFGDLSHSGQVCKGTPTL